jgi:20S proteasome alpha/beta subunit
MAEKVAKLGVDREDGYLYFIDKQGDVSRAKMARGGKKGGKPTKVAKAGVKKEKGYLYFLDKAGDISRAKMVRKGAGKKASKKKK